MQHSFMDASNDKKYFTIIPNILWAEDLKLTAHDLILYTTIKKVAGENGTCFMSTYSLAKEAKMSTGQVSKSKQKLAGAGLIEIVTKRRNARGWPVDHITITDIWSRNIEHFQKCSPGEQTPQSVHPVNTSSVNCSPGERNCSPGETEEEPLKKNPSVEEKEVEEEAEEEQIAASASHSSGIYNLLSSFGIDEPALSKLSNDSLEPETVRAWIMYLDTQDFPRKQGYLVKRLRNGNQPPTDFMQIATLTQAQLDTLASLQRSRHWSGDWRTSYDTLDNAGIDEELAEMWYQKIKA